MVSRAKDVKQRGRQPGTLELSPPKSSRTRQREAFLLTLCPCRNASSCDSFKRLAIAIVAAMAAQNSLYKQTGMPRGPERFGFAKGDAHDELRKVIEAFKSRADLSDPEQAAVRAIHRNASSCVVV